MFPGVRSTRGRRAEGPWRQLLANDVVGVSLVRERADAIFKAGDSFLIDRRVQLVTLTAVVFAPASSGSVIWAACGAAP